MERKTAFNRMSEDDVKTLTEKLGVSREEFTNYFNELPKHCLITESELVSLNADNAALLEAGKSAYEGWRKGEDVVTPMMKLSEVVFTPHPGDTLFNELVQLRQIKESVSKIDWVMLTQLLDDKEVCKPFSAYFLQVLKNQITQTTLALAESGCKAEK